MKEKIMSDYKVFTVIFLFLMGTASIEPMGLEAGRDSWIAYSIAMVIGLVFATILARLFQMYPGMNFYDIVEECFGKIAGRIINFFILLFILDQFVEISRNYNNFISTVALDKTPMVVISGVLLISAGYLVNKSDIVMGRWTKLFSGVYVVLIIIIFIALIKNIETDNLLPAFVVPANQIAIASIKMFLFPFGQLFVFTLIFNKQRKNKSNYKPYIAGVIIVTILLLGINVINILVLGLDRTNEYIYPFYNSMTMIEYGGFFKRVEIIGSILFTIGAFIKTSVYLLATCNGVKKIFAIRRKTYIIVPIVFIGINLSIIKFDSFMQFYLEYTDAWYYYILLFNVMIPVLIYLVAEGKNILKKIDF